MVPVSELELPGYLFASVYDEVSSTMDVARERSVELHGGAGGAGLVVARHQSSGRGRQGRSWVSESGSFMGTFLFPSQCPAALLSGYSLAVGVGVAAALRECGAVVKLKWPNDIVVSSVAGLCKMGGILIEVNEVSGERVLLVGLGVNISCAPSDVAHTTCLREQLKGAEAPSVALVTEKVAHALLAVHQEFSRCGGFGVFQTRWEALSAYQAGRTELTIEISPTNIVSGIYAGIHATGSLKLSVNGEERLIHSGHVVASL